MKICPRCGSKKFWLLSSGQIRCSKCGLTRESSQNTWQKTRILSYWKGRLVEFFSLGVPAYRLRFQVPYSKPTILRWFRTLQEVIYEDSMKDLKLYLEVRDQANVAGELPVKLLSLVYTRETVKSLLFLSHRGPKRPCNRTLPAIPKQGVSTIPMTGLPIPSYLFGGIVGLY